ncbi:MAG: hypothetical protein P1U65_06820 [Minwuia sp.]|nr:hypothetical protein [Minwuia sp.]
MNDLKLLAEKMDADDPLASWRDRFVIPDGLTYLDGNSLGVLPAHVPPRVADAVTSCCSSFSTRLPNSG